MRTDPLTFLSGELETLRQQGLFRSLKILQDRQQATSHFGNVTLLNCDALRNKNHFADAVLEAIGTQLAVSPRRQLKLVANLPYCIGTPVISNLLASELPWAAMIVTIQLELAERIRAKPGSEHYSALSVWIQSQCHVNILRKLPPTVFWPRPGVDSASPRPSIICVGVTHAKRSTAC